MSEALKPEHSDRRVGLVLDELGYFDPRLVGAANPAAHAAAFALASDLSHAVDHRPPYYSRMSGDNIFVAVLIGASTLSLLLLVAALFWR